MDLSLCMVSNVQQSGSLAIGAQEDADVETSSEGYAARFSGPVGRWLLSVQEQAVKEMLTGRGIESVLDVGGGHGQLAGPLSGSYKVTVLGSSPLCSGRISDLVGSGVCQFRVGSLLSLPFPDRSFDAVLCFRYASHCPEWPRLIEELCRVARRSVILDYPPLRSFNALYPMLFRMKKRLEGNTRHFIIFKERQILERFAAYGYHPGARRGQFFFPMVMHRRLGLPIVSGGLERLSSALGLNRLFGSPIIQEMVRDSE